MGLESMPHLALGNTKKGMTQIVIQKNDASGANTIESLLRQKEAIKKQAYASGQSIVAKQVKSMNKLCEESYIHVPTIKSLEYFGEVSGIITPRREKLKLLAVKNPVAFGAAAFNATKELVADLGANFKYYAPSESVGLEVARKGMLVESSFSIDLDSREAYSYADHSEENLTRLNNIIIAINKQLRGLDDESLEKERYWVSDAVVRTLDLYHLFTAKNVQAGMTYTVIEDKWLNRNSVAAREFAPHMMKLYNYAEKYGLIYDTPYPNYSMSEARSVMIESLSKSTLKEHALYSEVFDYVKADFISSSAGNKYQLGYLIPQNLYIDKLAADLETFLNHISLCEIIGRLRY